MILYTSRVVSVLGILLLVLTCCGCPSEPAEEEPFADVVWQTSGYGIDGCENGILSDGVLYQPEGWYGGISATRVSDGKLLWQIGQKFSAKSNVVVSGERLYIFSCAIHEDGIDVEDYLWVLNKESGTVMARVTLTGSPVLHQSEGWVALYKGYLYFPCTDDVFNPTVDGIFRMAETDIELSGDTDQTRSVSLFLDVTQYQRPSVRFLFENDRVYVYLGGAGWRGRLPEGETLIPGYYPQDAVQVLCLNLDGTEIWKTGLQYAGRVSGANDVLLMDDTRLYLGDWSGRACLNKADGSLVWEQSGFTSSDRLVLEGKKLYSTCDVSLNCFNAETGALQWQFNSSFTLDSNPIIWKSRVYCVMADALRVFEAGNGKLLFTNSDWGLPGYRVQGFIPYQDNIIYLPKINEITALRLRDL